MTSGSPAPDSQGADVPRRWPPLVDGNAVGAFLWPLAAVALLLARHRLGEEQERWGAVILVTFAAAVAVVRAGVLLHRVASRQLRWLSCYLAGRLTLGDDALQFAHSGATVTVRRGEVIAIRERGHWRQRRRARRGTAVFVVVAPATGRTHLSLPPVFDRTPGVLAERLMRWAPTPHLSAGPAPECAALPSKVYDAAAAGTLAAPAVGIPAGRGWLRSGPYATVLLGAAAAAGAPPVFADTARYLAAALLLLPLAWLIGTLREVRPRKGVALVLSPAEMLFRTRAGTVSVPWASVARIHSADRPRFTLLDGYHRARRLVVERRDGATIRYDEAFLGVPVEVVVALAEWLRRGATTCADAAVREKGAHGAGSSQ
jgi:hypothetical protein